MQKKLEDSDISLSEYEFQKPIRAKRDRLGAWPDWPISTIMKQNFTFKGPIRYALLVWGVGIASVLTVRFFEIVMLVTFDHL